MLQYNLIGKELSDSETKKITPEFKEDPSEDMLRLEIEKLAGRYPRYGYRRISQLLRGRPHRRVSPCYPIDEIRSPVGFHQTGFLSNHLFPTAIELIQADTHRNLAPENC